jgi:hypothetical protein
MSEQKEKLKLIGDIIIAEEHFNHNEVKKNPIWYNDRFDQLYEESLLSLQLKKNLLKRKINNG